MFYWDEVTNISSKFGLVDFREEYFDRNHFKVKFILAFIRTSLFYENELPMIHAQFMLRKENHLRSS
ncbi:hypothetical protein VNO77_26780 [Canavalia gladiata]|uniref:Uncharacterized protein n=1 Tax=Canavalia gladiata TaxID=3824 RepID=A0AAN9Q9Y1_CANGL